MTAKVIKVSVKNTYGNTRVYPVCNTAKLLSELSSSATFSERDVKAIKSLGYTIEQVAQDAPDWL